jgi:hypothetical protein
MKLWQSERVFFGRHSWLVMVEMMEMVMTTLTEMEMVMVMGMMVMAIEMMMMMMAMTALMETYLLAILHLPGSVSHLTAARQFDVVLIP